MCEICRFYSDEGNVRNIPEIILQMEDELRFANPIASPEDFLFLPKGSVWVTENNKGQAYLYACDSQGTVWIDGHPLPNVGKDVQRAVQAYAMFLTQ